MKIHVDINADASGFDYAEPGKYVLRVKKVEEKQGPNAPYLNVEMEFADPNILGIKGKKVGSIWEICTLSTKNNAQFRLRQVVEAVGLTWGDFDTADLVGQELTAEVGTELYQGNMKNIVTKYYQKNQ